MKYLFTSESVTEGHPDKVCDQIADAILDAILKDDAHAKVACEAVATTGLVLVMGKSPPQLMSIFKRLCGKPWLPSVMIVGRLALMRKI